MDLEEDSDSDADSDAEVDQLNASQYGGGPGSRNTTPQRPRRPSATPPLLPTPTRLRTSITRTSRAQDTDILSRAVQHRANLIPPPTTPSPEVAEDVPVRPTSPLTNDTVAHALPPARQQSEEFFVPDLIDHLLHLADDGSAKGGAKAAPSHGDTVEHPADHPADHPTKHTDQALTHDADDSNGSTDMARLGGRSDEVSKKRGRR